jgi:hypothetical protein
VQVDQDQPMVQLNPKMMTEFFTTLYRDDVKDNVYENHLHQSEKKMAKSLGIVANATQRFALDYFNKFDSMMKSGSLDRVLADSFY